MNKVLRGLMIGSSLLIIATSANAMDIKGKIVDSETAATLSGATVDLKDSNGNVLQEVTADSAGRFLFTGVNSGTYKIEVKETGYVGIDKSVSITTKNKNVSIKAIPSAGGTVNVTGKVTDSLGTGIGGLEVQLMKEDPRFGSSTMSKYVVDKATTAQDGTYTLKAIKPSDTSTYTYYVRVLGHGIKNTSATGQFSVTKDTTNIANENVTVDVLPTTTATITGQVLDAIGNPVANAKVTAPLRETNYPETVTNANGEFSLVVPANGILQVPIRVSKSGYQTVRETIIPNANTTLALQTINLISK
ncbi:Cna B domain protein [Thermodesulfobium narugense DSM 14796]|uniref:Cna B domain protein n=1 Tax=Thermodesulfobium narugense DSM 14796 TaxID=747365 RepID=M1E6J7_9BACT|nr:carboxypeptidase regulatory-like domain-containing protein [Thermodesulfobium narugense]AEE14060.1 Cna B domain protein [Thermodesulfobium narugense DSM 14796]